MSTIDSIYKKEYFAYVPNPLAETKYIYHAYVNDTGYMYRWNVNSNESYVDVNSCRYYINDSNNSEDCTEKNAKLAKEFYNNNYLFTLNELNITKEELMKLFDDVTSKYIEPHKKELIKNDKGITYNEFLTNIENSSLYKIAKTPTAVSIIEKKLFTDDTTIYNMYVTFEENKVDVLFLEYWEKIYIIYDNKNNGYSIMTKNDNCLYSIKNSTYAGNCLESDRKIIEEYIGTYDYYYLQFTSTLRTTLKEFIDFIEQYYINNL